MTYARYVLLLGLLAGSLGCGGPEGDAPEEFAPMPATDAVQSEAVAPLSTDGEPQD